MNFFSDMCMTVRMSIPLKKQCTHMNDFRSRQVQSIRFILQKRAVFQILLFQILLFLRFGNQAESLNFFELTKRCAKLPLIFNLKFSTLFVPSQS